MSDGGGGLKKMEDDPNLAFRGGGTEMEGNQIRYMFLILLDLVVLDVTALFR
jgi:hypothetical protein